MKNNLQLFVIGLFMTLTTFSQQYVDTPYLQDYADKYECCSAKRELELFIV